MKEKELFIKTLSKLISYKSVNAPPCGDLPFGEENKKALDFFLETAKSFGLKTFNYQNYIGEVRLGSGEELGIIGHLDVVPAGDGWNTDPFTLTIKDGVYYGRGVGDDKLPLLLILFILKELKESGIKINKTIRFFAGCNEETGWKDAEYFSKNYGFPEYGFSPDGDFPVSYAEKGMAVVDFCFPLFKNFYGVKGGTVINAVCGNAECNMKGEIKEELLNKYGLTKKGDKIFSKGKSAHGSRPEAGVNAIKPLLEFFKVCGEETENILDCLFYDKGGIGKIQTEQGKTTISPDLIFEKEGKVHIQCDLRYPYPIKFEDIKKIIDGFGLEYDYEIHHDTQYVDKNCDMVKTLINAYNFVTGENRVPVSQAGSTFARVFKKGVAFGPEFPLNPSSIHEPNECVSEENVIKTYNIYKKAIFDLVK